VILATTGPAPAPVEDTRTPQERLAAKIGALLEEFPDIDKDTRALLEMAKEGFTILPLEKIHPEGAD
jgi:hypothetical protein